MVDQLKLQTEKPLISKLFSYCEYQLETKHSTRQAHGLISFLHSYEKK